MIHTVHRRTQLVPLSSLFRFQNYVVYTERWFVVLVFQAQVHMIMCDPLHIRMPRYSYCASG